MARQTRGPHVETLQELRRLLNVARSTVYQWRNREGFPRNADGTYPVGEIAVWVRRMRSRSAQRGDAQLLDDVDGHLSQDRAAANLEFRRLRTEHERINLEAKRGALVTREEVEQDRAEILAELRRNLLDILPHRVAPKSADVQAALRREIRIFLEPFAR
jgi:hypothetical protein